MDENARLNLPDDHYLAKKPSEAAALLKLEREKRKRWVAMYLNEPAHDVTLSDSTEPVLPDSHKCGAGRGFECCIFLTVGTDGFVCERDGMLHAMLSNRNARGEMVARREPNEVWPGCMKFPGQGGTP